MSFRVGLFFIPGVHTSDLLLSPQLLVLARLSVAFIVWLRVWPRLFLLDRASGLRVWAVTSSLGLNFYQSRIHMCICVMGYKVWHIHYIQFRQFTIDTYHFWNITKDSINGFVYIPVFILNTVGFYSELGWPFNQPSPSLEKRDQKQIRSLQFFFLTNLSDPQTQNQVF